MNKSLLVEVFVPTTDAYNTDYEGLRGSLATGYPVGPHHILTARHILFPEPPLVRDPRYPIKVRWHYHLEHPQADEQGWIELPPDAEAILWPGSDARDAPPGDTNLDAMLLEAPRPETASGWRELSPDPPETDLAWESEGFPHATKYDDQREPCSFKGTCFSKAAPEPYFEVKADAPPREEDDWRGASGMPLFAGRRIVGIAQRVPRCFGAERLHATPAWKLLQDTAFRAALGLDERKASLLALRDALCRDLDGLCADALAEALDAQDVIAGLETETKAAALAERLLETDVRDCIKALRKAQQRVVREAGEQAAAVLLHIANQVVPALFDRGVVRQVEQQVPAALVPLPAGILTVAELIMAASDGRPARFRPREHEDHKPPGELNLPLHPEQGIKTSPSAALAGHLQRKLNPGEAAVKGLRTAVDDYLLGTFFRADPDEPDYGPRERILLTSDTLLRRKEDTGETYYLVFRPPVDPNEREPFLDMVERLKADFPAIAVIELDTAFEQVRADRNLVDPLCRMLPLKPRHTEADG